MAARTLTVTVLGFSFGTDAIAAGRVFRRASATLDHCSIWRTRDGRRWSVLVVDQSGRAADFDWSPGRRFDVPDDLSARLIRRRLRLALEAPADQDEMRQDATYPGGAVITDAGTVEDVPYATCDFCGTSAAISDAWTVIADSFRLSIPEIAYEWGSLGSWLACAACAPIVDRQDVEELVRHVVGIRRSRGDLRDADEARAHEAIYRKMYAGLFAQARGMRPALRFQLEECQHPADEVGPWGPDGAPLCRVCGRQNP